MPTIGPDHFIVYHSPPDHPGMYVLKRWPQQEPATVKTFPVCVDERLEVVRKYIPDGYANTGTPDGPHMVEVWVHE